jgi:purine-binding chemotaxis protein CheW
MEIIDKPEESFNPIAEAEKNQTTLSLDELIAEIDNEIGNPSAIVRSEEEISTEPIITPTSFQNQFILFALEKTLFALPLASATEIGRRPDITPLPNLPNWVLGISNVRGEIISFIDLKAFFGISTTRTKLERRFLIIHNQDMKVGIIVDRIMGILSLEQIDADLQNSPYREGEIANYILGVAVSGENLTNILDVHKLLSCARMTGFKEN